jgi:hypothetical protein
VRLLQLKDEHAAEKERLTDEVRSIQWSPYDPVREVDADP